MFKNKIFVTSQPNASTLQFVKDIFAASNNREFPQKLVDTRLKDTNGDLVGVCIPYEIDTKYYTAKVDFWLDEIDKVTEKETIKAYCEKDTEISKVIDAFVFIFDKNEPSSFNTVKEWLSFLDQTEPGIRLCIGTSSEQPFDMQVDAEINDWCLLNSFDYVDMDEKSDIPMDKVGIDLALEIIQTNFWDGMVKKNVSGVAEDEALLSDLQELKLAHDRDILRLGDGDDDEEEIGEMPTQHEIDKMRDELFGDIDGEDGLDKAFEAIQAMREHGKNLSDEERRKMAAQVALSFAAQLGLLSLVLVLGIMAVACGDSAQVDKRALELANLKILQQMTASQSLTATVAASITQNAQTAGQNTVPATNTASVSASATSASASASTETSNDSDSGYPDDGKAWSDLPTSSSFGNSIYAGAATFATPTRSGSVSPLYPIQSAANVTFKWGYTALRVRPVNLTLNAVGPNSVTVDIAALNGSATEAVWNLGSVPIDTPLMNGYYKIQLYDQRGVSVAYSPGWMVPCTTLSIALYSPDLYDPITTVSGYCPTCFYSAGISFREAFGPIAVAIGIAALTSTLVLINLLG
ncbi:conserved hypothetical protein [Mucor ambiguus]|uniref:DUF7137 domain-containing protein n=1 Tax=Mucor ambiguus TaxID=91626 RepID=A0A0C9LUD9_9FUNG|nr:conserved hypothetical protein [Mucor ambiguus]